MKLACESFGSFCNLKKNNITSLVASENNHISKIISKYSLTTSVNYISLGTQCKPFAPFTEVQFNLSQVPHTDIKVMHDYL